MARMIPSFIDESAPSGERDVWHLLSGGPPSWTVIHSLDLAPWRGSRRTEVDFVVIIPDCGILCIEVKSHDRIEYVEDGWQPATLGTGPFKQIQDGVKTLHRRLKSDAPFTSSLPKIGVCIFPNARFDRSCVAVADWEYMDSAAFRRHATADTFCQELRERLTLGVSAERLPVIPEVMAPQRVDAFVNLCLPIRKRVPERRDELAAREAQLATSLREPQKFTLQLCGENDRVLVTGGAGTGKTLIAIELALQASVRYERVAFVCFNRLVSEWTQRRVSAAQPGPTLMVDRAIRMLASLAGVEIPAAASDQFWSDELPLLVQDRLTDPSAAQETRFDYLIVDEAQDLLARPWIWESLMLLLKGGAGDGRFVLFGDIEGQNLSGAGTTHESLRELVAVARPVSWRLTENCRNYEVVGKAAVQLSGFSPTIYSGYLRPGGSFSNLNYVRVDGGRDQVAKLRSVLQDIRSRGFRDSDITVLSFCSPERSAARALVQEGGRLLPAGTSDGAVTYTSVHAFKGLENKVIVVTDLELVHAPAGRALFYTALTRATDAVHVLCCEDDMQQILNWST